jgi:hypothetical protein
MDAVPAGTEPAANAESTGMLLHVWTILSAVELRCMATQVDCASLLHTTLLKQNCCSCTMRLLAGLDGHCARQQRTWPAHTSTQSSSTRCFLEPLHEGADCLVCVEC